MTDSAKYIYHNIRRMRNINYIDITLEYVGITIDI